MEINAWNEKECGMFRFSFVLSYASFLRSFAIYRSLRFSSLLFVNENLQIFIEYLSAGGRKQSNEFGLVITLSVRSTFHFDSAPGTFDRGIQNVETKTADATLSTPLVPFISIMRRKRTITMVSSRKGENSMKLEKEKFGKGFKEREKSRIKKGKKKQKRKTWWNSRKEKFGKGLKEREELKNKWNSRREKFEKAAKKIEN